MIQGLPTLTPEENRLLQEDGICKWIPTENPSCPKRMVSKAFLDRPLTAFPTTIRHAPSKSTSWIEVPEDPASAEALISIGLKRTAATKIANDFATRRDPTHCPDVVIDYVRGHIFQLRLKEWANFSKEECLSRLGVADWLTNHILDPRFAVLSETKSLESWLVGTFRTNWDQLEDRCYKLHDYIAMRNGADVLAGMGERSRL